MREKANSFSFKYYQTNRTNLIIFHNSKDFPFSIFKTEIFVKFEFQIIQEVKIIIKTKFQKIIELKKKF